MGRVAKRRVKLGLTWAVWLVQLVVVRAAEPLPVATAKPWVPELQVEKYQLPNGLTVILHEDHTTPLVAVNVVYNVGAKDDPPGRTGFAHRFEHLMFLGSEHNVGKHIWPISPYCASHQGTTLRDRTEYRETVTSNALELALWLEADRMGFLLPAMTERKLDNARDVVWMERRQTLDDLPLGEVRETLYRALYPPGHAYRHSTFGSMADLSAARLADVSSFFRRHYGPNNAFLCVAGDFKPAQARRWIRKYFGPLRPRALIRSPEAVVTSLANPRHITLFDRVSHARAELIWLTVPANHPDEAALDVLASVLGGASRWNRLFRALVYDREIATEVGASHPTFLLAGNFEVDLVAMNGHKLDELVQLALGEIERLKRDGPTADEVRRVKIERRRLQLQELESVTSKAGVFNRSAATLGDPLAYRAVLGKIFAVTPADVRRVAREYLGARRIRLDVLPGARTAHPYERDLDPVEPDQQADVQRLVSREAFDRSVVPESGPTPHFRAPAPEARRLFTGLKLRIVERHELPSVTLKLVVKSGETSIPRGKEGLSSIAVNLLEEGTKSRSSLPLEGDLIEIGASLSTDGFLESTMVSLTAPTRHLERALDLYADVILHPSFPDKELHRLKVGRIAHLEARGDTASQIAEDVFPRLLYPPDHPYGRTGLGTLESVRSITRDDVVAFHRRTFVPGNAALVVVGDVRADEIAAALEARFGNWLPGPIPPSPNLPHLPSPSVLETIYLIDKPEAEQSVMTIGCVGTALEAPDRYAVEVLRTELTGRIYSNLRESKAYTYGFTSSFRHHMSAAPFVVTGAVHTLETKGSLVEVLKEMSDLAGPRPATEADIIQVQSGMIAPWFERFETNAGVAAEVSYLVAHRLPDDHFATVQDSFAAVTKTNCEWVARQYLSAERMTILVVGDRAWIEAALKTLPSVKTIRLLDTRGNALPEPALVQETPARSGIQERVKTHVPD